MSRPVLRRSALLTVPFLLTGAGPATAKIVEYPSDPSATPIARAMTRDAKLVRRAVFSALPPGSKPAAVSTTKLAGFPTHGSSFGLLTPLDLSHRTLAEMARMRRPTATSAIGDLQAAGVLERVDAGWLLHGEPPRPDAS